MQQPEEYRLESLYGQEAPPEVSILLEKPILEEKLEEKAVPTELGIGTAQTPTRDAGFYSRLLELPVPVVLFTLLVAGAALIGCCALTLYYLFTVLLSVPGGP